MSYTIKLEQGKYIVINDNGSLTILRGGEPWPAAEELKHVKLVGALAARIQELEVTIRAVTHGTLITGEVRLDDGMRNFDPCNLQCVAEWEAKLRNVLKQGE